MVIIDTRDMFDCDDDVPTADERAIRKLERDYREALGAYELRLEVVERG